jgi:hypothetical protein
MKSPGRIRTAHLDRFAGDGRLTPKQVASFVKSESDFDSDDDPRAPVYRALKNAPAAARCRRR